MANNNNVQNVKFLRNGSVFAAENNKTAREVAREAMQSQLTNLADGTAILGRYQEQGQDVKTLVGFVYANDNAKTLTIFDVDGASADVEALRQEINAKLGNGVTSANTATAQLAALSGNNQSTSAETSVEGAKRYADELINNLEYTGVTTGDGVYVTNVTETDGVISASTATLPTVDDTAVAKKFVTAVDQTNGEIAISRGEITSTDKTITLADGQDGGVDFSVNVDNETLIVNTSTGVISVASAALVQYEGDDDTIQISAESEGVRTVSSLLTIQKVTTGLSEIVKEEYHLVGASGNTIGDPVQIYKDSHIVSITYITEGEHAQNLEYVYIDASGNTQTTYVDMSELVIEAEFASGVTVTDGVAHGVVDPTSETFLTVGASGFKLSGVQDAIDDAVEALDAEVSGETADAKVNVKVTEEDGVITAVTVVGTDIASDADLAALSAKTVTEVASSNASISATTAATADDTVSVDLVTDASKIKMSGFTAAQSGFTGISESSSVTDAVKAIETAFLDNEEVVAEALNDLDGRLDTVEDNYISGITVNGTSVTVTDNVAPLVVNSATSATTAQNNAAITVATDANGNITLGLATIDCGTY